MQILINHKNKIENKLEFNKIGGNDTIKKNTKVYNNYEQLSPNKNVMMPIVLRTSQIMAAYHRGINHKGFENIHA